MHWALLSELFGLGLGAVDAVGIAFMPILLAQPRGLLRAWVFVAGSFLALLSLGVLFTGGLGKYVLEITVKRPWLVPGIELFGGIVLIGLGLFMLRRAMTGAQTHAPDNLVEKLRLPIPLLLVFGAVLVTVQSLIDVVFIVAMVEAGTFALPLPGMLMAACAYAVGALLLQVAVIVAFVLTPHHRRDEVMGGFTDWLGRKGEFWAGVVSLLLGAGILGLALKQLLVIAL